MKQTKFEFEAMGSGTGIGTQYIDLTKAMTLVNGQMHYQFKGDKPLAYMVTVRQSNNGGSIETAGTSWAVRNACVKTAAAWRRMLKKAGVKKKDLNTYGKELRLTFDSAHTANFGGGDPTTNTPVDLVPKHLISGGVCEYATGTHRDNAGVAAENYVTALTTIPLAPYGYDAGGTVFREHAFDHTDMIVPDEDGDQAGEISWKAHLLGSSSVVDVYIDSRENTLDVKDDDFDEELGSADNYLTLMLSDNEESSDDVIESVADQGDYRPYTLSYQNKPLVQVGAGQNVQGQDSAFVAPLGLLKWSPDRDGDLLTVTVTAIAEM